MRGAAKRDLLPTNSGFVGIHVCVILKINNNKMFHVFKIQVTMTGSQSQSEWDTEWMIHVMYVHMKSFCCVSVHSTRLLFGTLEICKHISSE